MISQEKDGLDAPSVVGAKTLDDLGRVWSAVDEVTEKYEQAVGGGFAIKLGMNLRDRFLRRSSRPWTSPMTYAR